jgi:hypothetical protein
MACGLTCVASLTLAACAPSLTEMREREPARTWQAPSTPPAAVLDCVQARLDSEPSRPWPFMKPMANMRTSREQTGDAVALIARGQVNNAMEFIISARPVGAGSTVELRTWADWPRVIGPVIEGCAR